MIQSIDSHNLLIEVNTEAQKATKIINCLLQIHIATEETKYGFSMEDLKLMLADKRYCPY